MNISIIYEDSHILVCKKPAGFPVQTKQMGRPDCVSELRNYLYEKEKKEPYLGLVHRLDQPVQGLMVFAKNKKAAADLSGQVTKHLLCKHYLAVVCGSLSAQKGTLTDYIVKDGRSNTSRIAKEGEKDAKEAILHYQIIAEKEGLALAEIELVTGRHHQIRVQFAHAGLPLWGDVKYNPEFAEKRAMVALCAYQLGFTHPVTKKQMTYEMRPEGEVFQKLLPEA